MIWLNKAIRIFMSIVFAIALVAGLLLVFYWINKIPWLLPAIVITLLIGALSVAVYNLFD